MLFLKSISKQWKAVTVQFNIFELYDSEKKGSCKDCFSLSGADPGFSEGGGGGRTNFWLHYLIVIVA